MQKDFNPTFYFSSFEQFHGEKKECRANSHIKVQEQQSEQSKSNSNNINISSHLLNSQKKKKPPTTLKTPLEI